MPVTLTGMASGLDTDSIIQQLMQVESTKVTAVQKRQVQVTQHKTDLDNVRTALNKIKSAAADLAAVSLWKPTQTTGSSDATKLDVSVTGGAGIGGHSIQINRLASSAQHGFNFTPPATDGSLTFYYGSDPNAADNSKVTINVAANASATDVATAINANEAAPVFAAVIKDNGVDKLVFSSRKTGQSSDFTVDSSALAGSLSADTNYDRTGASLNASINVDGGAEQNPESNIIDTAIPGVRVTLKGVSSSPVTVNTTQPAVDTKAIADKVTAFVNAYNSAVDSVRTQLTEKRDPKATTSAGLQQGQLFGDSQLNSMLGQLKNQMTQTLTGLGLTSLADIGVTIPKATASGTVSDDAKQGKLVIDSDALNKAINADYTKVRDLFSGKGTTKGLSALLSSFVDAQTSSTGIITGRMNTDDSQLKDFTDQIDALNKRMDDEQTRLKAQFAAMEAAMSQSQTQQAWLTSQIASLP
jgi:flagellar hook-associated protein 2